MRAGDAVKRDVFLKISLVIFTTAITLKWGRYSRQNTNIPHIKRDVAPPNVVGRIP